MERYQEVESRAVPPAHPPFFLRFIHIECLERQRLARVSIPAAGAQSFSALCKGLSSVQGKR